MMFGIDLTGKSVQPDFALSAWGPQLPSIAVADTPRLAYVINRRSLRRSAYALGCAVLLCAGVSCAPVMPPSKASAATPAPAVAAARSATTYYVRVDGGTPAHCTGRSDAAYPGSGKNRACAWQHPFDALPPTGAARIVGGDTLMIGPGSYKMGYNPPATDPYYPKCQGGNSYDCVAQAIPSGPSPSQPTRILGSGGPSCSAPPELWGTQAAYSIFNLEGRSNVQIGCLELTDHAQCIRNSGGDATAVKCKNSSYPPNQDWAWMGINAADSSNVVLTDLNIHGFAMWGVQAARLTDWTLQRVKINGNGWAGWEGDRDNDGSGRGSSNRGTIGFIDVEIAWNGCAERYPQVGTFGNCWGQEQGGYGDGLGAGRTGGNWVFEGGHIHHNASDGLDLLYADGSGNVTVRGLRADSNAGNQVKASGPMTVENSVLIGNCAALAGSGLRNGELCRASGNTLSLQPINNAQVNVRHNTITGQGDCLVVSHLGSSNSRIEMRNNALIGGTSWPALHYSAPETKDSCLHYWVPPDSGAPSSGEPPVSYVDNLIWHVRGNACPAGNRCGEDSDTASCLLRGLAGGSSAAAIATAAGRCLRGGGPSS